MGRTLRRRPRRLLAATAIFGMVGGSLAIMGTAHAAVMLSGSTIDAAGNYVDGYVYVADTDGGFVAGAATTGGTFDIPVEDGSYKIDFSPNDPTFAREYYRDKASFDTADVVVVSGTAQVLAPWTIDRRPFVRGVVHTSDGRPVRNAQVTAVDATTGDTVRTVYTPRDGTFALAADAAVKLVFSGYDPRTGEALATEWFNDKTSQETADPVAPVAAGADLGVVSLAPGGTIAGRVTDEAGAPIHRAYVCANQCDYTDPNGNYLIEGVSTGDQVVQFTDPIGDYVGEIWNNVPLGSYGSANPVTVAPGQAVTGIDAALAAAPVTTPNGVDLSGTVRDELGGIAVGYEVLAYDTPADPRDRTVVARAITNRAGQYHFAQLDRIGGETEFKVVVAGGSPREDGDFARASVWAGNKTGYGTATVVTAAPTTMDFVQPVAGGVSGAITSDAGGVPDSPYVLFRDSDGANAASAQNADFEADGTYDVRDVWAGEYTVQLAAYEHVPEWWRNTIASRAKTITVKPGQMVTGITASLAKDVSAVERPSIKGDAWVGKKLRLDVGVWTQMASNEFGYEWLVGGKVVSTAGTLKVTKSMLGKKITGRVTNDIGFAQGQAVTKATPKVGYKPKLKAKVSARSAAITLKVKPLKAKKVKAVVTVLEVVGTKKNGEAKLKKLGKAKITKGTGVARFGKALGKGKHKLVFRIKGKGKVGSGDITKKVKLKR